MDGKYLEAKIVSQLENRGHPGMFVVTVICPYKCGDLHVHGWESGDQTPRVADCAQGKHKMYVIKDPAGGGSQ